MMNFETDNINEKSKSLSNIGLFLIGATGGIGVVITFVCIPFVSPALRRICLPYVPATTQQVENVIEALKGRSGTLIDLGSGDGRIVLAAAKAGFKAYGIELNPWLVCYSRLAAIVNGLSAKTSFYKKDLWKYNLKPYNNVVLFGVEQMMSEIETKFKNELETGSVVVACRFPLPTMDPIVVIGHGVDTVWVYRIPQALR